MGLISGAINDALQSIGNGLMNGGDAVLQGGYSMWKSCNEITTSYITKSPQSAPSAWSVVTGGAFTLSLSVAASLAVLFFAMGWVRESIDIRNTFSLENIFRFFIRFALTASLLVNSLALVEAVTDCTTAIVSSVSTEIDGEEELSGAFDSLKEAMEADEECTGADWLGNGFICLIDGVIGGLVIIVCAVSIVLSVLSRLFKLLLCIPFAPVAFSGFAGGMGFSQTGISWIKTFLGYALEAVVIALALQISFGLFADAALFQIESGTDAVSVILLICNYCMPMITASACVKGADTIVRRCLGLG